MSVWMGVKALFSRYVWLFHPEIGHFCQKIWLFCRNIHTFVDVDMVVSTCVCLHLSFCPPLLHPHPLSPTHTLCPCRAWTMQLICTPWTSLPSGILFCTKKPISWQKSYAFWRKSLISWQKSPIFWQQSPIFWQKSCILQTTQEKTNLHHIHLLTEYLCCLTQEPYFLTKEP